MKHYVDLLENIINNGSSKNGARKGMPETLSVFGYQYTLDLRNGFPILANKGQSFKDVYIELLWFMMGDHNIQFLVDNGNMFWLEDAFNYYEKKISESDNKTWETLTFEEFKERILERRYFKSYRPKRDLKGYWLGNTGAQYPYTWRNIPGNDQLLNLIKGIYENPNGRRHIISSMDINKVDDLALYWCHSFFQVNIDGNFMDLKMYQRSADAFLGVPYNMSTYCLMLEILCQIFGYIPRYFIHTFGDLHLYKPHLDKVRLYIDVEKNNPVELPRLVFKDKSLFCLDRHNLEEISDEDLDRMVWDWYEKDVFGLEGYTPGVKITGKLFTGLK